MGLDLVKFLMKEMDKNLITFFKFGEGGAGGEGAPLMILGVASIFLFSPLFL